MNRLGLIGGKNVWWGDKPAYNGNGTYKSQWAFWNVDKPDVIDFKSDPITKYLGDDMCVPSSYLSTHGEPHPNITDIKEVDELNFEKLEELHNQGYTKAHLNVDNYEGVGHRMPVSKIKYVPNKYFKVESYDPEHMINVIDPNNGAVLRTYAPKVTYNLYNVPFTFDNFYLFP